MTADSKCALMAKFKFHAKCDDKNNDFSKYTERSRKNKSRNAPIVKVSENLSMIVYWQIVKINNNYNYHKYLRIHTFKIIQKIFFHRKCQKVQRAAFHNDMHISSVNLHLLSSVTKTLTMQNIRIFKSFDFK